MHPPTIKRDLKYTCIKSAFYTRCRTAKIHWRNLIGLNCPIERKSKKKKKKKQHKKKKKQQYHLMIKCSTFCSALWAHLFNTNRSTRHKCISMRFCIFVILLNCNYICALERGNERPVIIYQLGVGRGLGYFWQIRHFFGDPPPANFYFEVDAPPLPQPTTDGFFLSVAWPTGVQLLVFFCSSVPVVLFDTPGISRCRSQHVSVESASLLHHSIYL